jgi:ribosomal-protein-alanine N-acetyltransferase
MILQTERLSLRPLAMEDLKDLHAMMGDAEVMAFWDVTPIEDIDLTAAIVQGQIRDVEHGAAIYWVMTRQTDDAFVGCCDLSEIDRWHARAEIGFMLARPFWGGGYAFEAMRAVIDEAAKALGLKRLSARVHAGNDRSVRLLERLDFQDEGVLRGYIQRAGERRDCRMFGLLI